MAKIKKPLEMENGVQVRTMTDLKENFDIEKIVGYFLNGKLQIWLEDRYYDDEAQAISSLDAADEELAKKLYEIFGVEYSDDIAIDVESINLRNSRIERLKQFTDDTEIINNIDFVAFNQNELDGLCSAGAKKIYLCDGDFELPDNKPNTSFVKIANANVKEKKIEKKEPERTEKKPVTNNCEKVNVVFADKAFERNEEILLVENVEYKYFYNYRLKNILKKNDVSITDISSLRYFKFKKIIGCGKYILFTRSDDDNNFLYSYSIETNSYEIIANSVGDFTVCTESDNTTGTLVVNQYIYYVTENKTSTFLSLTYSTKISKCDFTGNNKAIIYDFGNISDKIFDLKYKNNILYFRKISHISYLHYNAISTEFLKTHSIEKHITL